MNVLLICLGGALGCLSRYGIAVAFGGLSGLPWSTLIVNVAGSLALGALAGVLPQAGVHADAVRAFAVIGFCGGFTTFSTFSYETFRLFEDGRFALAAVYVLVSVLAGFAAVALGWSLTKSA